MLDFDCLYALSSVNMSMFAGMVASKAKKKNISEKEFELVSKKGFVLFRFLKSDSSSAKTAALDNPMYTFSEHHLVHVEIVSKDDNSGFLRWSETDQSFYCTHDCISFQDRKYDFGSFQISITKDNSVCSISSPFTGSRLRHTSLQLKLQPGDVNSKKSPFALDSVWNLKKAEICKVTGSKAVDPFTGKSFGSLSESTPCRQPEASYTDAYIYIHKPLRHLETQIFLEAAYDHGLCQDAGTLNENISQIGNLAPPTKRLRRSLPDAPRIYLLQGAGGMEKGADALDFASPFELTPEATYRIEQSHTLRKRGGVAGFQKGTEQFNLLIIELDRIIRSNLLRYPDHPVLGTTNQQKFSLGFCEFIYLPAKTSISPHRDGGSDCDFAGVFCVKGISQVTVSGRNFDLDELDMYLFKPQVQVHSVGEPKNSDWGRLVVTLRYFYS
jgi:hypothetical protein